MTQETPEALPSWALRVAGRSERGPVRSYNEDDFQVLAHEDLVVVCDGMGGNCSGAPAAKTAAWTVIERYERGDPPGFLDLVDPSLDVAAVTQLARARLLEAVEAASARLRRVALPDIGCTLVALQLAGRHAVVAHVGDGRAVRWRDGELTRVTADHSVAGVAAARGVTVPPDQLAHYRRITTRALGFDGASSIGAIDLHVVDARPGDLFILTTDGLHDVVPDDELAALARRHEHEPARCADALMERALARETRDNATVCVALVDRDGARGLSHGRTSRPTAPWLYAPYGPLAAVPERFKQLDKSRAIESFREIHALVMGDDS